MLLQHSDDVTYMSLEAQQHRDDIRAEDMSSGISSVHLRHERRTVVVQDEMFCRKPGEVMKILSASETMADDTRQCFHFTTTFLCH